MLLSLFALNLFCFSQDRQRYQTSLPRFIEEPVLSQPPLDLMQKSMNNSLSIREQNQKHIKILLDYILDLKREVKEQQFLNTMDKYYKQLKEYYEKPYHDYSTTQGIKNIEIAIKEEINNYITRENEKPKKLFINGENNFENKKFEQAIKDYTDLIILAPNFIYSYYKRGLSYFFVGKNSLALTDMSTYISNKNEDFDINVYYFRGYIYYNQDKYSNAITDFNNYIEVIKNEPTAYEFRGWSKYNTNDFIGALSDFNRQIELTPNSAEAYNNRGSAKSELSDNYGAISDYTKAIELSPTFSMAYNNRGWSKFELKKYSEALIDLNKAIELDSKNWVAFDSRQETKFMLNDLKGCIADCNSAIALNPKVANSYFYRGRANYKLGDKTKACEDWSKAGELGHNEAYDFIKKYCNN